MRRTSDWCAETFTDIRRMCAACLRRNLVLCDWVQIYYIILFSDFFFAFYTQINELIYNFTTYYAGYYVCVSYLEGDKSFVSISSVPVPFSITSP
jgi:hypothetical protein